MSESKLVMAQKLHKVQNVLMNRSIQDTSLETILPLIFKECSENGLTFWFNFMENEAVLNLRDITHDNYELNIRYNYTNAPKHDDFSIINDIKENLLINTFLILEKEIVVTDVASSDKKETGEESIIVSGDTPTPKHIRDAIDRIKAKGLPVTVEAINNHLPLGQMSTSARMECNRYLKAMSEGSQ